MCDCCYFDDHDYCDERGCECRCNLERQRLRRIAAAWDLQRAYVEAYQLQAQAA